MFGIIVNLVLAALNGYLAVTYSKAGNTTGLVSHTAAAGFCVGMATATVIHLLQTNI